MSSEVGLGIRGCSEDARLATFSMVLDFVLERLADLSSGAEDEELVPREEDSSESSFEAILVRDLRKPGILILAIFSAKRDGTGVDLD